MDMREKLIPTLFMRCTACVVLAAPAKPFGCLLDSTQCTSDICCTALLLMAVAATSGQHHDMHGHPNVLVLLCTGHSSAGCCLKHVCWVPDSWNQKTCLECSSRSAVVLG
jgi:hypothetical protein